MWPRNCWGRQRKENGKSGDGRERGKSAWEGKMHSLVMHFMEESSESSLRSHRLAGYVVNLIWFIFICCAHFLFVSLSLATFHWWQQHQQQRRQQQQLLQVPSWRDFCFACDLWAKFIAMGRINFTFTCSSWTPHPLSHHPPLPTPPSGNASCNNLSLHCCCNR